MERTNPKLITKTFLQLENQASQCRLCNALAEQPAVLSPNNGNLHARIVFVAEAPGRFGAGRTGIPFYGDKSGENFETLLSYIGLSRDDVFITNAVLCNPIENGNNRRPKTSEIKNCSLYLKKTLAIIRPQVVVTLGSVALQAINLLLGTKYKLNKEVAKKLATPNFALFPLYHPSPRVTNWMRPLNQQKKDFKKIPR